MMNEHEISRLDPEQDHLEEVAMRVRETSRIVPHEERMLENLSQEDRAALESQSIEPYPLNVFRPSELISDWRKFQDKKNAGPYFKLAIEKRLLLPEHKERFSHVEVDFIEFDVWMLEELEKSKRLKILATVAEWERKTGCSIRFEGVVGVPHKQPFD